MNLSAFLLVLTIFVSFQCVVSNTDCTSDPNICVDGYACEKRCGPTSALMQYSCETDADCKKLPGGARALCKRYCMPNTEDDSEADVAKPEVKIVNGTTAAMGEFPYMVQLSEKGGYFECGESIIGPEWILTAGHCVVGGQIHSVVYGTNKLYNYGSDYPNTTIKVKNWFQHPKYTHTDMGIPVYDVGILQLETPIPFSDVAQPLKLVEANGTVPTHVQGLLSGWGVNETDGDPTPYLQKIALQLLTDAECTQKINSLVREDIFIATHNLCSDDYYNGECYGDSGSPYVINGIQYGIVSWSFKPCGIAPGTYSRIPNPEYRNWIKNVTGI